MSEVGHLDVERLCIHHKGEEFDCGVPEFNAKLLHFQTLFEAGERVLGFVVIDDSRAVLGYIVLSEITLRHEGRQLRCFTIPAMAIARDYQGSDLFDALKNRALNAMAVRQDNARAGGAPYGGLVCMPGDNKFLRRWLTGWGGFKPLSEGLFWIPLVEEDAGPADDDESEP
jgi:hypothetical protein